MQSQLKKTNLIAWYLTSVVWCSNFWVCLGHISSCLLAFKGSAGLCLWGFGVSPLFLMKEGVGVALPRKVAEALLICRTLDSFPFYEGEHMAWAENPWKVFLSILPIKFQMSVSFSFYPVFPTFLLRQLISYMSHTLDLSWMFVFWYFTWSIAVFVLCNMNRCKILYIFPQFHIHFSLIVPLSSYLIYLLLSTTSRKEKSGPTFHHLFGNILR